MDIRRIESGKRDFLPLLLLGDEQEDMIDRYLDRGTLLALYDGGLRAAMVRHVAGACRTAGGTRLLVGTGDSALTLPFYRACGFRESHRVPNFFLQFYDHPIYEGGRLLSDMVYLSMEL